MPDIVCSETTLLEDPVLSPRIRSLARLRNGVDPCIGRYSWSSPGVSLITFFAALTLGRTPVEVGISPSRMKAAVSHEQGKLTMVVISNTDSF